MIRCAIFVANFLVMASIASAAANVKTIDRRNASERNDYYVVLAARGNSATGHAFVALGEHNHDAQACKGTAFGQYPKAAKDKVKALIGPVPGGVVEEHFASSAAATHRLVVRVSSEQFKKVEKLRKEWLDKDFHLTVVDCVTFVAEAAKAIGLTVPDRRNHTFPQSFIRELLKQND